MKKNSKICMHRTETSQWTVRAQYAPQYTPQVPETGPENNPAVTAEIFRSAICDTFESQAISQFMEITHSLAGRLPFGFALSPTVTSTSSCRRALRWTHP